MARYRLHWFVPAVLALIAAGPLSAQLKERSKKTQPKAKTEVAEPPEEDASYKPKEYAFNPLRAQQELNVGNFYFKKGDYNAAARRFSESSKWNPTSAEAFLRLGEAESKLKDQDAACEAYRKYLKLAPDDKHAAGVRKKASHCKPASPGRS